MLVFGPTEKDPRSADVQRPYKTREVGGLGRRALTSEARPARVAPGAPPLLIGPERAPSHRNQNQLQVITGA